MANLKKFFRGLVHSTGEDDDMSALLDTDLGKLLLVIEEEVKNNGRTNGYYDFNISASDSYKALKKNPQKAAEMARFIFEYRAELVRPVSELSEWVVLQWRGFALFYGLMRGTLPIPADEVLSWIAAFKEDSETVRKIKRGEGLGYEEGKIISLGEWPIAYMMQMVERKAKKESLSRQAIALLEDMQNWSIMGETDFYGTNFQKIEGRITALLGSVDGAVLKVAPYKKLSGDDFGHQLEEELHALAPQEAEKWHRTFNLAASASGGKPTKAFIDQARDLKQDLGKEWVRGHIHDWFNKAFAVTVVDFERSMTVGNEQYSWTDQNLYTKSNVTLLKGLVWICEGFQDAKTINLVADLCEKSMRKIPGVGPAAQATANACLWYLEVTPGAEATARLSRLGTAIKQKNVQKRVAAIVEKKAEAAGVTTIQLQERVVPTYGLTQGQKTIAFDDYQLVIKIEGPGKVSQTWIKPDGSVQKTKPKIVADKSALKAKFDKAKAEVASLKKVLTSQRDRIDRLFAEDVTWPLEEIETYYVGHDLLCTIAGRLIWALDTNGTTTAALWREGHWQDLAGVPVKTDQQTTAQLWHPIDWETDAVMAWRARLAELEIIQPTKQAHREVYVLTDAERQTGVYSNRMAAHMLKQHQMATLMAARGWRYQLMGAFDDGMDDQWAFKAFATSDLVAQYLLHTNWDTDNWNDAGIYLYVGTDQLRFVRDGAAVELADVPVRLVSETMREADLFVGVASVGNDPLWADQGPTPAAREYWQSYSFGGLDGFAVTRKEVLETLLPRLKIRDVAHIDGNFLIVDGKINTYKIHLGSSNILMSPGDRYLCIVPSGVTKGGQVALPFEGDSGLSVILSKALMLADDDKITASDIVSQLTHGR